VPATTKVDPVTRPPVASIRHTDEAISAGLDGVEVTVQIPADAGLNLTVLAMATVVPGGPDDGVSVIAGNVVTLRVVFA